MLEILMAHNQAPHPCVVLLFHQLALKDIHNPILESNTVITVNSFFFLLTWYDLSLSYTKGKRLLTWISSTDDKKKGYVNFILLPNMVIGQGMYQFTTVALSNA